MASVAMASLSSLCSSAPTASFHLLRQVSPMPLLSRVDMSKEVTMLPCLSFGGASSQLILSHNECNRIVTHAVAEVLAGDPSTEAEETAPVAKLKLESDLLKKKAKRIELRRRRLVRKRHMRKKGRWPPSKMAKLKNV